MPENRFSFEVQANDGDSTAKPARPPTVTSFTVLAFEGEEKVSQPFEYRLVLAYEKTTIDFEKVVNQNATLTMELVEVSAAPTTASNAASSTASTTTKSKKVVKGIVSSFRVTQQLDDGQLECEAVLVPKLWRLGMFYRSRVFQGLTVVEIVDKVLGQDLAPLTQDQLDAADLLGGVPDTNNVPALIKGTDYDFKFTDPVAFVYPKREFVMQYQETDLDFFQRLIEDIGIYYYFDGGKLIFNDSKSLHPDITGNKSVKYQKAMAPAKDRIYRFVSNERVVPKTVSVRDYDYEAFSQHASKNIDTNTTSAGNDYARVGTYTEHGRYAVADRGWVGLKTGKDGDGIPADPVTNAEDNRVSRLKRIALVRAEELEAQRERGDGLSNVSRLQAGHVFTLAGHFLTPVNGDYFITSVRHRYAKVATKVRETIKVKDKEHTVEHTEENLVYENEFTCLPAGIQYRPPRVTPIPRVPGIMTATVKNDDKMAYLDEEGRYRVQFPFDPAPEAGPYKGSEAKNPSRPIRLAQPYAGKDFGMHFPNRDNVEMVFACLDGDPNRPLGLSVVPTPWMHSPVPNTELKLISQNPVAGSAASAATQGGSAWDETTFDELKNVIRTAVGHQIVMDDGDPGSSVGITIQTGKSENAAGRDLHWSSKIEMGGYRHMSPVEQAFGIASHTIGWLKTGLSRDYPGLASGALGAVASAVNTNNYLDDTYGTTTPVGINIATNKNVDITGKDGVNITSPNLFGMFSSSLMGEDSITKRSQYYAEAISKFVVNTVWQDLVSNTAELADGLADNIKDYSKKGYPHPLGQALLNWRSNIIDQRISALFFTLLQRTGVNISSMGELKLTSLQSTAVAAGQGGLTLNSYGGIEQKADLDVKIEAAQGIRIAAGGERYKTDGILGVVGKRAKPFLPVLKAIQFVSSLGERLGRKKEYNEAEYPIELENEQGSIFIHTGGPDEDGKGNILIQTEGTGDIKAFANKEKIHGFSTKEVVFEVGDREGLKDEAVLKQYDDAKKGSKLGTRIKQTDKVVDVFGKDEVMLSTMKDGSESYLKIKKGDEIEIKCGQASIVLKKNGDITFKGTNIKLDAMQNIDAKGMDVKVSAQKEVSIKGELGVKTEGGITNDVKGVMVTLDGTMTVVKGSLVKVGS